ncbi:NAD(P)-dependent oxidoreductase [Azospirillum canadense]|uniref:NAD(P)-dependent oxidoreductase n=1 Tax=Azospirillum canadense TaxID=403962 RepID=UPI00222748DF|nr:hydroxyacid dehydrogenase [Azospirillum canadense]MCW2240512.1 phosphoglycerate dehydrogenase-like enzyme [Azospirillum canadense]
MSRPKIVLWRPMYDPRGHALLEEGGARVVVVDTSSAEELKKELADADALWVRTPERVTADILAAGKRLVVVSTSGFGTDNVDLRTATELGIMVVNYPGFGRIPVAEHTILMLLAAAKQLVWTDAKTRDGSAWESRTGMELFELEGKTVGIIGTGYIGSEVARKLRLGFRCNVLGYDPHVDPRIPLVNDITMQGDLHAMLAQCQMLCVCAELTDETRSIIGTEELAALPKGAIVVNTARGQILDLDALAQALDSGHLRSAGLDVVYPEPLPPGHPLLSNPKVVFSPHTGGLSVETSARLARAAAEQMHTVLRGGMPTYPVNPDAWTAAASRRPVRA